LRRGRRILLTTTHCADGLCGQHELSRLNVDLRQTREQHMIAVARVDDQASRLADSVAPRCASRSRAKAVRVARCDEDFADINVKS